MVWFGCSQGQETERTEVEGYTDSDYASNLDNRKSTSGYLFTYVGGMISWRSKLQESTALSTIEAEYIVVFEAAKAQGLHCPNLYDST